MRLILSFNTIIKVCTCPSDPFTVTNGVKRAGVLSPHLFAVYLDELSVQLSTPRAGCTVGNIFVNHLLFADDTCVFGPSLSGFHRLSICCDYTGELEIVFDCNKTIGVACYTSCFPEWRVKFAKQVNYLHVLLHVSLKDATDTQRKLKSLYCVARKLRGILA